MFDAVDRACPRAASGGAARYRRRMVGRLARAALPRARRSRPAQTKPVVAALPTPSGFRAPMLPSRSGAWRRVRGGRPRGHGRAGHPRRPAGAARSARRKRPQDFLAEVAALTPGDLVVHVDHGIGRFSGLQDDRGGGRAARLPGASLRRRRPLFLPVENIELLTRYGSEETEVATRPARRRRLAGPQGADEAAHPRDGGRADQDRRRARR